MVRYKKRYFVVQFDRQNDVFNETTANARPLDIKDDILVNAIKEVVEEMHGDFGRASVATGLRTIYCNPETKICLIQCRFGPHKIIGSSLPFLTKLKADKVVPRLIYTGATIKNCYKRILSYQQNQLRLWLPRLKNRTQEEKRELEERLMKIRSFDNANNGKEDV